MTSLERCEKIEALVRQDPHYKKMLIKCKYLEDKLNDALRPLPLKTRDIVWDLIMYCEDMSQYVLEYACDRMVFSEESMENQSAGVLTNAKNDNKYPHLHKL